VSVLSSSVQWDFDHDTSATPWRGDDERLPTKLMRAGVYVMQAEAMLAGRRSVKPFSVIGHFQANYSVPYAQR
jgi:hypothetical protein